MTYGWAILIVAIVLVALFQLGIFNQQQVSRVRAGACQVYKNAATGASLEGECQGIWPQFVAQFNGASSQVSMNMPNLPLSASPFTISAWVEPTGSLSSSVVVQFGTVSPEEASHIWASSGSVLTGFAYDNPGTSGAPVITTGKWYHLAYSYNGGTTSTIYVNGQSYTQTFASSGNVAGTGGLIGTDGMGSSFAGRISNVQLYNTTLSASEINTLYLEGIGAAPMDPTHLVGWWPLNGNTNDYSGNNNNGAQTSISYNSTWTSGYVQP